MKKFKMAMISILTVVISLLCLVGCGTTGTYRFQSISYDGDTYYVGDDMPGTNIEIPEDYYTIELKDNNTFALNMKQKTGYYDDEWKTITQYGTWKEEDGTITLMMEGREVMSGTLEGNTLTYEDTYETKIVLVK